ncbi:MAG TPA: methyltransferase domain-containing protein [Thermoanaerobaculia bacterium]|nr:methyltransferase domain-containing protein [Thermoanaerobaculia bacterium]
MFTPRRVPADELLDEHDAPRADMERSLVDLRRINRWLGGVAIHQRLLRRMTNAPRSVLDLGAGSGDVLDALPGDVLRIGLDFNIRHLLFAPQGTRVRRVVGDATKLPFKNDSIDVVGSGHFFHHFSPEENVVIANEALRVARVGVAVNDTRRHYAPLLFVLLIGALRLVGRITRYDAPASVRQGYTLDEARDVAKKTRASRWQVVRAFPFRFGILLWK